MMGGRLLTNMSHQPNYLGKHDQAVQLARTAQEGARGQVTATTMAMFLTIWISYFDAAELAGEGAT